MGLIGNFFALGNLMSPYFTPFGLTVKQISIVGISNLLSGVFAAILLGAFLDRTRIYKKSLIFLSCASVLGTLSLSYYTLPKANENFPLFLLNSSLLGALLMPAMPLCMSFSTEVTFPMQPSLANGLCHLLA